MTLAKAAGKPRIIDRVFAILGAPSAVQQPEAMKKADAAIGLAKQVQSQSEAHVQEVHDLYAGMMRDLDKTLL